MVKKHGIAKVGDLLSNLAAGTLNSHEYTRQPVPEWNVKADEYVLLNNVKIVDVNVGALRQEPAVLIHKKRIDTLISPDEFAQVKEKYPIKREIDGHGNYLIPGLSDLHGHLSLISEFDLSLGGLERNQRLGCREITFGEDVVEVSSAAAPVLFQLVETDDKAGL